MATKSIGETRNSARIPSTMPAAPASRANDQALLMPTGAAKSVRPFQDPSIFAGNGRSLGEQGHPGDDRCHGDQEIRNDMGKPKDGQHNHRDSGDRLNPRGSRRAATAFVSGTLRYGHDESLLGQSGSSTWRWQEIGKCRHPRPPTAPTLGWRSADARCQLLNASKHTSLRGDTPGPLQ